MDVPEPRGRFRRYATAGILFQGGAAAVDTSTIVAALVNRLTGSPYAVGAAAAIARYGWLFPQLFVGYFAQRRRRRLPFYMVGAFGRVACLTCLAALLAVAGGLPIAFVTALFFALWTAYQPVDKVSPGRGASGLIPCRCDLWGVRRWRWASRVSVKAT